MLEILIQSVLFVSFLAALGLMGRAQWDMQTRYSKDRLRKYVYLGLLVAPFAISLCWVMLPIWAFLITPVLYTLLHIKTRDHALVFCATLLVSVITVQAENIRSYAGIEYQEQKSVQ